MFIGAGTLINVATVVLGSLLGIALGNRLPERTREVVTQILGLISLTIGGLSIAEGMSEAFSAEVGASARLLVVLGALLIGGVIGSAVQLEDRLESSAGWLRRRFVKGADEGSFIDAAVTATLIFCIGPLSIIGSLADGLGQGADQLIVKAVMDGFASIAFASSLGIGVIFSVIPMLLYQGSLTVLGAVAGDILSPGQVDSLTLTGGIILLGLGFKLTGIRQVPIGDMLPALAVAPVLTWAVGLAL